MAENRTRINCLEGSYADHYTTNASCQYMEIYQVLNVHAIKYKVNVHNAFV
jgi:hypothetical protein